MKIKHIVSISGGKDSTALMLLTKEISEKTGREFIYAFADTGNETPILYDYLDYLENKLSVDINRVKPDFSHKVKHKRWVVDTKWRKEGIPEEIINAALGELIPSGNPFLDLCMWKGRFPSRMAQFCTQYLKAEAIEELVYKPYTKDGFKILSWQGVRGQESAKRAKDPILQWTDKNIWAFRPIKNWLWEDVFAMHKKHNVKPNPLYTLGMGRVGCMPCINANKNELLEISKRFPKEIDRIRDWEIRVGKCSKRGASSFFSDTINGPDKSNIDQAIGWATTSRGGKQYDLESFMPAPSCSSAYGLCE